MDDCCHDAVGSHARAAASIDRSSRSPPPKPGEWPRQLSDGSNSGGGTHEPPRPTRSVRTVSAPGACPPPPSSLSLPGHNNGGLLGLVRLQQHRHSYLHNPSKGGSTSPSLLFHDDALSSPPSQPPSSPVADKHDSQGVGAARTLNFIAVPGLTEGVDICGDGVIRQAEGGLSPYYPPWSGSPSLATSKGSSPSTTVQSPQPARSRSVSAPLCHRAPPPPSKLGRSDSSSSGDSSGGEVVETPPRWERRATLSDGRPEAFGASDVMMCED